MKPKGIPVTFEGRVESGTTAPDIIAARRTQAEKVLAHLSRLNAIKQGAPLGPVTIHLHPANACNHTCPWCEPAPYRMAHMTNVPEKAMLELVEQAKALHVKSILLTGGGEPTANPATGRFAFKALEFGLALSMNTNGGLLHKSMNDTLREAILAGAFSAGSIRFTIDGFDSESHREYHGKDDWRIVNDAVFGIAQSKKTVVNIGMLIRDSVQQVVERALGHSVTPTGAFAAALDIVMRQTEYWARCGVKMIQIRPVYATTKEENDRIKQNWREWEHVLAAAKRELAQAGYDILNPYSSHMDGVHHKRCWSSCNIAHLQTTLGANGDEFVCCALKIKYGMKTHGMKWYDRDTGECTWSRQWMDAARLKLVEDIDVFAADCGRCSQSAYNDVLFNVNQYATDLL